MSATAWHDEDAFWELVEPMIFSADRLAQTPQEVDQVEALGYTGEYALEFEVGHIEPVETGYAKWLNYWKELV